MKPDYASPPGLDEAKVIASYPRSRTVDVQYVTSDRSRQNVLVIGGYGDYSFPKVGDLVCVLSSQHKDYCVGVVEHFYEAKLNGDVKDEFTGERVYVKAVKDGEVYISNVLKRIFLFLSNSGNFSLLSGDNDGLAYYLKNRYLRLKGQITQIIGSGTTGAFGYVYRNRGKGYEPIPSTENPLAPAVEFMTEIVFNKLKVARIQLGHVKDTLGVDEVSSYGGLLEAIIEVFSAGVPLASLKMDKSGNIELASKAAKTVVDGLEVQLGGVTAAQSVMKGNAYTSAETQFLTSFNTFLGQLATFVGQCALITDVSKINLLTPAATAFQPAIVNMIAAATAFSSGLTGHLSLKTKTV